MPPTSPSDALIAARDRARRLDPGRAADACAARYEGDAEQGTFEIPFLGGCVRLTFPGFEFAEDSPPVPEHILALLVHHLATSDGTPPTGRIVSFAQLPDGVFYAKAFRGYSGAAIARAFGGAPDALDTAVESLAGTAVDAAADRAWRLPALPRVPLYLHWWEGDEEFEPRAEILFDETASHHLPTDGCAILGSWLTACLRRCRGG